MGRKQTIFVDDSKLLAAICDAFTGRRKAVLKAIADHESSGALGGGYWQQLQRELREVDCRGIRQDLEAFAGRLLTASERLRWQAAVRRLIEAGKLLRDGTMIRPAPEALADAMRAKRAAARVIVVPPCSGGRTND